MLRELSLISLLALTCQQGVQAVELITCEMGTARLNCDQGTIKVLAANYGRTDRTTCSAERPANQLSNVQCILSKSLNMTATQCDGKQNCSIVASNANFGDPCGGIYKYLNVTYNCIVPPPPLPPPTLPKQPITCESKTASLSCDKGTIKVLAANYGRTDRTTCSAGRPANQLSNVQCILSKSLNVIATQCDGKQNCSIVASNANFGDPCGGIYKYLNVTYDCIVPPPPPPPPKKIIICEKQSRTITCEGRSRLYIDQAYYGRRDRTTCPHSDVGAAFSASISVQTKKLRLRCNGKTHCHLHASGLDFGDWHSRDHKYLEVFYFCTLRASFD